MFPRSRFAAVASSPAKKAPRRKSLRTGAIGGLAVLTGVGLAACGSSGERQ